MRKTSIFHKIGCVKASASAQHDDDHIELLTTNDHVFNWMMGEEGGNWEARV